MDREIPFLRRNPSAITENEPYAKVLPYKISADGRGGGLRLVFCKDRTLKPIPPYG